MIDCETKMQTTEPEAMEAAEAVNEPVKDVITVLVKMPGDAAQMVSIHTLALSMSTLAKDVISPTLCAYSERTSRGVFNFEMKGMEFTGPVALVETDPMGAAVDMSLNTQAELKAEHPLLFKAMYLEDKRAVVASLCDTLKLTKACENLLKLSYSKSEKGTEVVVAKYRNGLELAINVTADSGIALIKDVVKALI